MRWDLDFFRSGHDLSCINHTNNVHLKFLVLISLRRNKTFAKQRVKSYIFNNLKVLELFIQFYQHIIQQEFVFGKGEFMFIKLMIIEARDVALCYSAVLKCAGLWVCFSANPFPTNYIYQNVLFPKH